MLYFRNIFIFLSLVDVNYPPS